MQHSSNMNNCNLLFLLALPQYASIMQEPSIGRPLYIRVVRMIIETRAVSGAAILSAISSIMISELHMMQRSA